MASVFKSINIHTKRLY